MRIIIIFSIISLLFLSCKNKKIATQEDSKKSDITVPVKDSSNFAGNDKDSILLDLTRKVMAALKNKDYKLLSALAHPELGIRFSPYSFIDTVHDKVVTPAMIISETFRNKKINWGSIDNTGEPINLTFDKYLSAYVYDVDFLHPEKIKVNEIIGAGNTRNNLKDIYHGCDFTESHFSGFDKRYEGMDWRSLRLVFKQKGGTFYLIGVIHDEWTT